MHFISSILATALSCSLLVSGSALPVDLSETSNALDTRADLETCPGIDYEMVRAGRFKVRCNKDTRNDGEGGFNHTQADDFDDCMGQCEGKWNRSWCRYVAFPGPINQRGHCYMKGKNPGGYVNVTGTKLGIRQ
ncbi:unnamed protein product [Cercospora beticola]|nr:unnamed protein product [Cercospora beticola]